MLKRIRYIAGWLFQDFQTRPVPLEGISGIITELSLFIVVMLGAGAMVMLIFPSDTLACYQNGLIVNVLGFAWAWRILVDKSNASIIVRIVMILGFLAINAKIITVVFTGTI